MNDFTFDERGRFVIQDYAAKRPFASFLPGIAGLLGSELRDYEPAQLIEQFVHIHPLFKLPVTNVVGLRVLRLAPHPGVAMR